MDGPASPYGDDCVACTMGPLALMTMRLNRAVPVPRTHTGACVGQYASLQCFTKPSRKCALVNRFANPWDATWARSREQRHLPPDPAIHENPIRRHMMNMTGKVATSFIAVAAFSAFLFTSTRADSMKPVLMATIVVIADAAQPSATPASGVRNSKETSGAKLNDLQSN